MNGKVEDCRREVEREIKIKMRGETGGNRRWRGSKGGGTGDKMEEKGN